jgi:hypothetical protein
VGAELRDMMTFLNPIKIKQKSEKPQPEQKEAVPR